MLWWKILICLISIHRIIHPVRSQDDDDDDEEEVEEEDELTTIPSSIVTDDMENQRVSSLIPSLIVSNRLNNGTESTIKQVNFNESSKQRIIVALAVLCAALVVILGFLVSIIVCQWLQHDRDEDDFTERTRKPRTDFVRSPCNYQDDTYRQTIQL